MLTVIEDGHTMLVTEDEYKMLTEDGNKALLLTDDG